MGVSVDEGGLFQPQHGGITRVLSTRWNSSAVGAATRSPRAMDDGPPRVRGFLGVCCRQWPHDVTRMRLLRVTCKIARALSALEDVRLYQRGALDA